MLTAILILLSNKSNIKLNRVHAHRPTLSRTTPVSTVYILFYCYHKRTYHWAMFPWTAKSLAYGQKCNLREVTPAENY